MSAIFGILDLEGRQLDDAWIQSMQQDMAHRGPDGQGLYREASVALGHLLLQVTPESIYDTSPYQEDDLVITANARLDERNALMDKLNIVDEERNTITDPQLLLRSYLKEGKNFVKNIYGDFSFAIWDKQKKELFCARDQMGIKPFLYYFKDNRFVFSTELKSIAKLAFVETGIDNIYLRKRALSICDEPHKTSLKNIYRLNSASTLLLNNVKLVIKQYWQPKYKRNKKFKREEDSAAAVKTILEKIMMDYCRVIGDIGVPLSGGLDSGTIACVAAKQLKNSGKKITSVTSVYTPGLENNDEPDEMEYLSETLKQEPGINAVFVYNSDKIFLSGLPKKFDNHYALVNGSYYIDEAIYAQFEKRLIRRVLSGYLGDCTVTNTSIKPIPILLTAGRFKALEKLLKQYNQNGVSVSALLKYSILTEFTPKIFQKFWSRYKVNFDDSRNIDALPLILNNKEWPKLQEKVNRTFKFPNFRERDLVKHLWPSQIYLFDEDWDCGAAHHQIEMTYPLCDRRLLELLLQLPVEHFHTDGKKRGLIRRAMAGILPDKIKNRTNSGSYAPGYPLLFKKEIKEMADFSQNGSLIAGIGDILNLEKLKNELENLSESKNDDSFTYKSWTLVELLMLTTFNLWYLKTYNNE